MDDSCAVCAETLEWVAYGPCGHREVCTICVARLRFICNDRRCCICKAESDIVFATKALGDYSRVISDFSLLPSELKEGRVGSYWYHEDTQSLFDDLEHYKMIKAMCRLSCSECDKNEGHQIDGTKHRGRFRNIDQLKGHLHHQHRLIMCSLCLEGRKVFICEQKLYTREQLKHHISSGDSEVDGTESERGGFTGHPLCDFCRSPFYGDNELYTHMSTEHYKCHICQSQHPGQYEYYKNYDDMEVHFRREHFLCEDEACLAKKFIVFQHEAEFKRHNTLEHGGRMSRSKRSAALQIPTSFRYRRSNDGETHHGREGRGFGGESSDNHLAMAIQASLETANSTVRADPDSSSSSHVQSIRGHGRISDIDSIVESFESFTTTDGDRSSKYRQAVSNSMNALEETAFPPLPGNQQKTKRNAEANPTNYSMAAHLQRKNKRKAKVSSPAPAWPFVNRGPIPSSSASVSQIHTRSTTTNVASSSIRQSSSASSSSSHSHSGSAIKIIHSSSAPNLVSSERVLDFPPVSSVVRKVPSQTVLKVEDVQTANKSLVERIRLALNFDEEKYSIFKTISGEYRQGLVDTEAYLAYVQQFGLLHLVVELARLCPDVNKQRELIDTYKINFARLGHEDNGENGGNESKKGKGKGKEKEKEKGKHVAAVVERGGGSRERLADDIMATVHKLQSDFRRPSEEGGVVEVLMKDGYRGGGGKGKSKVVAIDEPREKTILLHAPPQPPLPGPSKVEVVGKSSKQQQQRKKTSKFHRVRLGDGSVERLLDIRQDDHRTASVEEKDNVDESKLPVRGVWKNGGGLKLLAKTK
ncbi:E3 ubiquitin-protein ligase HEL2-like [Impatiens glandulifera]|uniref:E3 ubiquitin-protein ligase HEL2-like n=1 Tax=Impatiens glandulifera TaxID=253017 RepID=UPI001FB0A866|nr:E3 ubiquitin-protein ligase HEL2-like [Impatiens glandulifera]